MFKWFSLLWNESGQIPSTLTDDFDAVLTTSLRNVQPRLHDNITRGNKVLSWLKSKGRMRKVNGGERIMIPLMHAQNSTADIYSGSFCAIRLRMSTSSPHLPQMYLPVGLGTVPPAGFHLISTVCTKPIPPHLHTRLSQSICVSTISTSLFHPAANSNPLPLHPLFSWHLYAVVC